MSVMASSLGQVGFQYFTSKGDQWVNSPHQLVVKEEGDENKEKYQLGDSI